jgi:hypothetical protein
MLPDASTRYIAHDGRSFESVDLESARKTILDALVAGVERVERHYAGSHHTTGSAYVGVEGKYVTRNISIQLIDEAYRHNTDELSSRTTS